MPFVRDWTRRDLAPTWWTTEEPPAQRLPCCRTGVLRRTGALRLASHRRASRRRVNLLEEPEPSRNRYRRKRIIEAHPFSQRPLKTEFGQEVDQRKRFPPSRLKWITSRLKRSQNLLKSRWLHCPRRTFDGWPSPRWPPRAPPRPQRVALKWVMHMLGLQYSNQIYMSPKECW